MEIQANQDGLWPFSQLILKTVSRNRMGRKEPETNGLFSVRVQNLDFTRQSNRQEGEAPTEGSGDT